jgi:hypothetical protein
MRFKSNLALAITLSLFVSSGVFAHKSPEPHKTPNFDYLQAGYAQFDIGFMKLDGYHVEGSFSVNENIFVRGRYLNTSKDIDNISNELDMTTVSIGYKLPVNKNTSYYAAISYEEISLGGGSDNESNDGYGASLGSKSFINPQVELYGELNYIKIDDLNLSEIGYEFGAQYYLNNHWSVGANYRKFDDTSLVNAGFRFSF